MGEITLNRKKKRSFYYSIRLSLLLVILIPVLTIGLVFSVAQHVVKEQISLSSENLLEQFFLRVDDIVKESRNLCMTLTQSEECRNYATYAAIAPEKITYQSVRVQKTLNEYLGEKYHDIFIYYPYTDRVVSGKNASNSLNDYYDIYYGGNEACRERFVEVTRPKSKKALLNTINISQEDSYLCVTMKNNSNSDVYDYVVVVVFNPTYVKEMLEKVGDSEQKGISLILNSQSAIVYTTDPTFLYDTDNIGDGKNTFLESVQGKKYRMHIKESGVIKAYYVYAVSNSYYWSELYELYIICGSSIAVSIILALFVLQRQNSKIYMPVEEVVNNLEKHTIIGYDANKRTEFEFIEEIFEKNLDEKKELIRKVQKGDLARQKGFVFSIINGTVKDFDEYDDVFKENGIDLHSGYFYVMAYQIEKNGGLAKDVLNFVVSNVLEEIFNSCYGVYSVWTQEYKGVLLLNVKNSLEVSDLLKILDKGRTFLEEHCNITATWGLSSCREGLKGIRIGYEEACLALEYHYLIGKEKVIEFKQIEKRDFKYPHKSELIMSHMLSDYFTGNVNDMSPQELVDNIMSAYCIDTSASLDTLECFRFETTSTLHRIMIESGYSHEEWKQNVYELLTKKDLINFKEKLIQIIYEIYQKKQEEAGNKDVYTKVRGYIREHYMEEQLCVATLGEITGIEPSYLSKMFKKKYQISVSNYILETRIGQAKELLKSTDMAIWEIAEQVGFLDSNSFIRAFKRQEGVTPGVYRGFFEQQKL